MKQTLKRLLPVAVSRRLRRLGRLRWVTKLGLVRAYSCDYLKNPWVAAKFVFTDPEVESHSFELTNENELCEFLARMLDVPINRVQMVLQEAKSDSILNRNRGFSLYRKRRPPVGRRLSWYIIARITRPKFVVETGIYDGLGSETLLRALQINASEGFPGILTSFDMFQDSGDAVHPSLRPNWRRVLGMTQDTLESALSKEAVDLFVRDTPPIPELIAFELKAAVTRSGSTLVVIDSSGDFATEQLLSLKSSHGLDGKVQTFIDRPLRHVQSENRQSYAVLRRKGGV
jgi:hypothetical protein